MPTENLQYLKESTAVGSQVAMAGNNNKPTGVRQTDLYL